MQYATQDETPPPFRTNNALPFKKITGSVLYYSRAVDPTVFIPLNDIEKEQISATEKQKPREANYWTIRPRTLTPKYVSMYQI
jgi:hypothetical protein